MLPTHTAYLPRDSAADGAGIWQHPWLAVTVVHYSNSCHLPDAQRGGAAQHGAVPFDSYTSPAVRRSKLPPACPDVVSVHLCLVIAPRAVPVIAAPVTGCGCYLCYKPAINPIHVEQARLSTSPPARAFAQSLNFEIGYNLTLVGFAVACYLSHGPATRACRTSRCPRLCTHVVESLM